MYPLYAFLFAAVSLGFTAATVTAPRWHHILLVKVIPVIGAAWCLFEAAIIFVR